MRLDQAIAARHADISRRKARELIGANRVLVNDRPVRVASREVSERDRITLIDALPDLTVLRETDDWIAVDKPSGMPTQPTRDRETRSLEELLRLRHRTIHLVHRIDTQTSGVVIFAKTKAAAAWLSQMFASREIKKTYLAIIEGTIAEDVTIDTPIEGKEAMTVIRPVRQSGDSTTRQLVEAEILTGRMHQIRIHLASVGHPVVGDRRYGSKVSSPRMLLHAWKLEHAELGSIEAPPPADFR